MSENKSLGFQACHATEAPAGEGWLQAKDSTGQGRAGRNGGPHRGPHSEMPPHGYPEFS